MKKHSFLNSHNGKLLIVAIGCLGVGLHRAIRSGAGRSEAREDPDALEETGDRTRATIRLCMILLLISRILNTRSRAA